MSNPFLIILTVIFITFAKAEDVSEHHQCPEQCNFTAWECYDSKYIYSDVTLTPHNGRWR